MVLMTKVKVKTNAGMVQVAGLGKIIPGIPRQLQLQHRGLHRHRLHHCFLPRTQLHPQVY